LSTELVAVLAVIFVAMVFDYTNGFHDAANAIATSVSTRALTPRIALGMAAVGNFIGAHLGAKVATTVGSGLIDPPRTVSGLSIVFAGVLGAICWNLITWYFGLPSSSSHALIGGLVGASLIAGEPVKWAGLVTKVVLPMILSPIAGVVFGFLFMIAILWTFRRGNPSRLNRGFRYAQIVSAAAMSVGHGLQDAAKTIGVIVLALYVGGFQDSLAHIPEWTYWTSATVLALGTYAGGWRIIRTLGRKIIDLRPPEGFAAETVASSMLFIFGIALGAPISTTHTITSAIMGVGATKRLSAVRWKVAGNIVIAWLTTFPASAAFACLAYLAIHPFFN
jgi:PiT family inorganic phosphate transporter